MVDERVPIIFICSSNLTDNEKGKLKQWIKDNQLFRFKESLCLAECSTCSYHRIVKVQDRLYRANNVCQLLNMIKG